jgi:hypothetical protein
MSAVVFILFYLRRRTRQRNDGEVNPDVTRPVADAGHLQSVEASRAGSSNDSTPDFTISPLALDIGPRSPRTPKTVDHISQSSPAAHLPSSQPTPPADVDVDMPPLITYLVNVMQTRQQRSTAESRLVSRPERASGVPDSAPPSYDSI